VEEDVTTLEAGTGLPNPWSDYDHYQYRLSLSLNRHSKITL
jgi:hypothetical protein